MKLFACFSTAAHVLCGWLASLPTSLPFTAGMCLRCTTIFCTSHSRSKEARPRPLVIFYRDFSTRIRRGGWAPRWTLYVVFPVLSYSLHTHPILPLFWAPLLSFTSVLHWLIIVSWRIQCQVGSHLSIAERKLPLGKRLSFKPCPELTCGVL